MSQRDYIQNKLKAFKTARESSVAARLLVRDDDLKSLYLGPSTGHLMSIACNAWDAGNLDRLDELFNKYDLTKHANNNSDLNGKLHENWLTIDENKQRKAANDTLSTISELLVAEYFEKREYIINSLSIWGKNPQDVIISKGKETKYIEIKYIPDSPEEYIRRIEAAKPDYVPEASTSSPTFADKAYYLFFRIAEAVIQLEQSEIPIDQRVVFIVFSDLASYEGRVSFKERNNITDYKWENAGFLKDLKNWEPIIVKQPDRWLQEANQIFLSTMKDYKLIDVEKHKKYQKK